MTNWLDWLTNPSEEDVRWMAEQDSRDKQVGELLREMHYFETSKKPPMLMEGEDETAYWTGRARNSPGFELTRIQAELTRRKNALRQAGNQ